MPTKTLYVSNEDDRLWTRATALADRRNRSMSEFVVRLLRQELINDKVKRPGCPSLDTERFTCPVTEPHRIGGDGCAFKLADD